MRQAHEILTAADRPSEPYASRPPRQKALKLAVWKHRSGGNRGHWSKKKWSADAIVALRRVLCEDGIGSVICSRAHS